jgi:hypothetical protein
MKAINKKELFTQGCLPFLVTSSSFGLRRTTVSQPDLQGNFNAAG